MGKNQIKHDIEQNWNKAKNFIPKERELIIYDPDDKVDYPRYKIGDGITNVSNLPFYVDENETEQFWNNF